MLAADIRKRRGGFALAAAFEVATGESLVVVGESGAGKTTLLRILAGLESADAGTIVIDGRPVFDGAAGVAEPAWKRPIALVTQEGALFPHLSTFDNVAFGLRAAGVAATEIPGRVGRALERVGAAAWRDRRPGSLSGGEQQRVALARATVLEPAVLLLDEPLSAVDAGARAALRADLRRLLAEQRCATVHVTHDPIDAITLGDRIAALEAGAITQLGSRNELFRRPRSSYVATLLGLNLFRGTIVRDGGRALVRGAGGDLVVTADEVSGEVYAIVNPDDVTLYREPPGGSAQNVLRGPVVEITPLPPRGERVRVSLATSPALVAEVTAQAVVQLRLAAGLEVHAAFKATAVEVFS